MDAHTVTPVAAALRYTVGSVATTLTEDEHIAAIEAASARLSRDVAAAGDDAPVPTCPDWDARALIAHIIMVHHWAASHLLADDPDAGPGEGDLRAGDENLFRRFDEGEQRLVAALRAAPDDLKAPVFLLDAPAPRAFWARRQAHETTIHGVDALAARLGRTPTSVECDIPARVALDGIDELLLGFVPRGASGWETSMTIAVRPTDSPRRWSLTIGPNRVVAAAHDLPDATAVLVGTAAQLYLGLWNRGDEIASVGDSDALAMWRAIERVSWS